MQASHLVWLVTSSLGATVRPLPAAHMALGHKCPNKKVNREGSKEWKRRLCLSQSATSFVRGSRMTTVSRLGTGTGVSRWPQPGAGGVQTQATGGRGAVTSSAGAVPRGHEIMRCRRSRGVDLLGARGQPAARHSDLIPAPGRRRKAAPPAGASRREINGRCLPVTSPAAPVAR